MGLGPGPEARSDTAYGPLFRSEAAVSDRASRLVWLFFAPLARRGGRERRFRIHLRGQKRARHFAVFIY